MKLSLMFLFALISFVSFAQKVESPGKPDDKPCPEGYVLILVDKYHWKCVDERAGNSLPVTLVYFRGGQVGKEVVLYWSTATETDCSYFEVQGSDDGKTFTAVGQVFPSQGTTTTQQYYRFKPPVYEYYRLVQVDQDGTRHTYFIIAVPFKKAAFQQEFNVIGQKIKG